MCTSALPKKYTLTSKRRKQINKKSEMHNTYLPFNGDNDIIHAYLTFFNNQNYACLVTYFRKQQTIRI